MRAYRPSVLQRKILVRELLSVDGLATGTILPSKVATLAHEACGGRVVERVFNVSVTCYQVVVRQGQSIPGGAAAGQGYGIVRNCQKHTGK